MNPADYPRSHSLGGWRRFMVEFKHLMEYRILNLSLGPEAQKLIDELVKSGRYATPEDVVAAALLTLDQQEWLGEFAPGELAGLLAEGEQSLAEEGTLDGDEAFELRRAHRARKRTP